MDSTNLRNFAILAHVDAGKTTLAEDFLYLGGAISSTGTVEEGLATMDYLLEEKERKITIEAGIATYPWRDGLHTLVDTPGHVDFGMEVEAALAGVEGGVLLLSILGGLETQTIEAWRKLRRRSLASLIFLNKLDLPGQEIQPLLNQIRSKLQIEPLLMTLPYYEENKLTGVVDMLNGKWVSLNPQAPREFHARPVPAHLQQSFQERLEQLLTVASEYCEGILEDYLETGKWKIGALVTGLALAFQSQRWVPIYTGSALNKIGVRQLMNGLHFFIPAPESKGQTGMMRVIKSASIQGYPDMRVVKFIVNFSDKPNFCQDIYGIQADSIHEKQQFLAGSLAAVQFKEPPTALKVGDCLDNKGHICSTLNYLPVSIPLLKCVLEPKREDDNHKIEEGLLHLSQRDPSIQFEKSLNTGVWQLSAVGEVQLEVTCERLKREFHCEFKRGQPIIQYFERLSTPVENIQFRSEIGKEIVSAVYRVLPTTSWEGPEVEFECPTPSLVREVTRSVLEQIHERGILGFGKFNGFLFRLMVLDMDPNERNLPLWQKSLLETLALRLNSKNIDIFEPIMKMQVTIPTPFCGAVLKDLAAKDVEILDLSSYLQNSLIACRITLKNTFGYTTLLRSLTKGQGYFVLSYEKHDRLKT